MSYCDRKAANCKNFIPWIAKCGHVGRYSGIDLLMSNILSKVWETLHPGRREWMRTRFIMVSGIPQNN